MGAVQPQATRKKDDKDFLSREFPMRDQDFNKIKSIAKTRTGIELGDHKKETIYSRIVRCIRRLKMSSFEQYLNYLEHNAEAELTNFINAITTNLTSFFREQHHFDFLVKEGLPDLMNRNKASKKLRIWSAGCSTGEEPYSIAITLKNVLPGKQWNAKVLATDLDTNVVQTGKNGIYDMNRLEGLSRDIVSKNFESVPGADNCLRVKEPVRQLIQFNRLNLLEQWPMKGKFDIIFCRNVVIYFSKETQRELFDRYANILNPNGYLFIGHSESLHGVTKRFEPIGRTIYRKLN